ncbi:uncharacterized protein LOC111328947 [Stylophora pistillata]|uniref:uncharacterized protein LOC111328947 n=1 Tax=Stylophora pistillata TaxID=50429 RepID=UPI000C041A0E|nr:uncharacterized protein LOC111328947 [Stylophora pistillata]
MRVICAGLSKTGTKSLTKALRILGYTAYDFSDHRDFHLDEWRATYSTGKVPDFTTMYDDVDAVAGLPASAWFQEIYEAFPDAKVILALRDNEEVWVRSLSKQIQFINTTDGFLTKISLSWLAPFLGSIFAPSEKARSLKENLLVQQMIMASYGSLNWKSTELFKKKYREHNQRVQAVVPKEKLLIFNVKQGWKPLCEFLERELPEEEFPRENVALSFVKQGISKELETIKSQLFMLIAICAFLVGVFYAAFYFRYHYV